MTPPTQAPERTESVQPMLYRDELRCLQSLTESKETIKARQKFNSYSDQQISMFGLFINSQMFVLEKKKDGSVSIEESGLIRNAALKSLKHGRALSNSISEIYQSSLAAYIGKEETISSRVSSDLERICLDVESKLVAAKSDKEVQILKEEVGSYVSKSSGIPNFKEGMDWICGIPQAELAYAQLKLKLLRIKALGEISGKVMDSYLSADIIGGSAISFLKGQIVGNGKDFPIYFWQQDANAYSKALRLIGTKKYERVEEVKPQTAVTITYFQKSPIETFTEIITRNNERLVFDKDQLLRITYFANDLIDCGFSQDDLSQLSGSFSCASGFLRRAKRRGFSGTQFNVFFDDLMSIARKQKRMPSSAEINALL